jgi:ADP-heptose:LPS heptosyltransferase
MSSRKNILIIRFKSIGDVVLTLPAVHALRENFPDAKITFLTIRENESLLRGFREVDEVIALDRAALRDKNPLRIFSEIFRMFRSVRAGKFSIAIDLQGYGETAWLARLSGARERWGTVYGRGRAWAYTRGLARQENLHPAEWNLFLLRECGLKIGEIKNQFFLPAEALIAAQKIFAENNFDPAKKTLFLQPFTSSPHKNWPLENFLALARYWRSRGAQIIFGGGPKDRAALESALAEKFLVCAGVPMVVTGGLMQLSTLIVGGDTGMLHLAIAQGKRALMLARDVSPGRPILFQHRDWVITPPNAPADIANISVETIITETEKIFRDENKN